MNTNKANKYFTFVTIPYRCDYPKPMPVVEEPKPMKSATPFHDVEHARNIRMLNTIEPIEVAPTQNNNTLASEILQLGNSIGYKAVQSKYYARGYEDFNPMKNTTLVEDCQSACIVAIYEEVSRLGLDTLKGVDSETMRNIARIAYRACNKSTDDLRRDIKKHMWIETRDNDGEIIAEQFEDVTSDIQKMTIDREDIQNGLKELSPLETRVLKYMALGYLDETIARRIYREDTPKTRHKVATIKHKIRAKMSQYVDR